MQQGGAVPAGRRQRNWLGWGSRSSSSAPARCFWIWTRCSRSSRIHPAAIVGLLALITLDRLLMAWKWTILLRVIGVRLPLGLITRFYYQGA